MPDIRNPAGAGDSHGGLVLVVTVSVVTGAAGGVIGAGYLAVLHWLTGVAGPGHHGAAARCAVLITAGAAISVLLAVLGDPGETGVLIDSVHVLKVVA